MKMEQVKYILEDEKYKNYIDIDFYAANGMRLGGINSATNWYIFEKDMLMLKVWHTMKICCNIYFSQ